MTTQSPIGPTDAAAPADAFAHAAPDAAGAAQGPVAPNAVTAPDAADAAENPDLAATADTSRRSPRLRRLLVTFAPANLGLFLLWGAVPGILLPLQIEGLDPSDKAANLAVVTTIGAFVAMLAQPLAGTLSDRTRSRYGPRASWIVGGTLCGGLALLGLAAANTLVQIAVAWTIVQIAYNFVQGPLSAVLPDRVPTARRGTFSAVVGFAAMLGALGGQVAATGFADHVGAGYVTFAGIALVTLALFVALNPDRDNRAAPRRPFSARALLRSYYFDPRRHPDFAWAFLGRLLLYLGYFVVLNYQLYVLQDYVGLGDDAVDFIPVLGAVMLVTTLIATAIGGPLSDRIGRRKPLIYLAAVICALGLIGPWVTPTTTGMLLFAAIGGFGFGFFQSVDTALVSEVLPAQEDFAKDLGVVNIAATLPQVLAPAAAGAVVVVLGYAALFPVGIVLLLLGGLAVAPIKSVR
ncbi:MFS transporter [Cryptosporangium aurantiacum]|uniref:MFS/sugar transport protein n=1 Tax=Cryptosporangium aurantiacum TaxID=134849 RepID=A0A1M7RND0_9ACTN|nr:MFS transporter [Cryptosporangium aurantiacum]SHN47700.1 MFS/sugar transport protein [Cryptosporangium aurantiacum]